MHISMSRNFYMMTCRDKLSSKGVRLCEGFCFNATRKYFVRKLYLCIGWAKDFLTELSKSDTSF